MEISSLRDLGYLRVSIGVYMNLPRPSPWLEGQTESDMDFFPHLQIKDDVKTT
jgi:hypothetical protein